MIAPEIIAALIAGGAGIAGGLASGLMQDDPKVDSKRSIPGGNPGSVSANKSSPQIYGGRADMNQIPRSSLAQSLLQGYKRG